MDLTDLKGDFGDLTEGGGGARAQETPGVVGGAGETGDSPFSIRSSLKGGLFLQDTAPEPPGATDTGVDPGDDTPEQIVGSDAATAGVVTQGGADSGGDAAQSGDAPVASGDAPYVSVVIPVYNESAILETALTQLFADIRATFQWSFELLVAENGSTDDTLAKAGQMAEIYPEIRVLSAGEPNYGLALRKGILQSRGQYVICDEIDLCDVDFYARAMEQLEFGADMVIGSKLLAESQDRRPLIRRFASRFFTFLLRVLVGFKGTDTHGLKAFNRAKLLDVVNACKVDKDVFASELVVRAGRSGRKVVEIPLTIEEKRMPSIRLFRRVPRVLKDLTKLTMAIRFNR